MAANPPSNDVWTAVLGPAKRKSSALAGEDALEPGSFDVNVNRPFAALANRLKEEMSQRWRNGERPTAEELLERHPELQAEPELAVQLVYEEYCLSQEFGDGMVAAELFSRFPQWRRYLQVLLDCHSLLGIPPRVEPPVVHDTVGDFFLLAELGKGAQGHVFLARHKTLANRHMVLKITPYAGDEHLSLARLQHTHIVPLYSVEDVPARQVRALVFPYLGRVTWQHLLEVLKPVPLAERRGKHVLDVLDQADGPSASALQSPARQLLARESYVEAVCRMGACLADTLHFAHERGLVHLDVKPSNVLLATDGQSLLLDFHLAQPPLRAGGPRPDSLGGTFGYMAPEQFRTFAAVKKGRPIPENVDGRADLYALGALLHEALSGEPPVRGKTPRPLSECNPQVSVGLSDIVQKCLAPEAEARYADGAQLAEDLRRHLEDRPLAGVANRSFAERWRKWRRRRPYVLAGWGLGLALLAAMVTTGVLWGTQRYERFQGAEKNFREGQLLMNQHRYADALRSLERGQQLLGEEPPSSPLGKSLAAHVRIAGRAKKVHELHFYADALRFFSLLEGQTPTMNYIMEASSRKAWEERGQLLDREQAPLETAVEETLRKDLLDLAICLADCRVRLNPDKGEAMRRDALKLLAEAEALFGQSPALLRERQRYAEALGEKELADEARRQADALKPKSAADHHALGWWLMRAGNFKEARTQLTLAQTKQAHNFWTNFSLGVCAAKLKEHQEAVEFFSVCVGQFPQSPECLQQRGQVYASLGRFERAHQDFNRAKELRVNQPEPDPAVVHYRQAVARLARQDKASALAELEKALKDRKDYAPALELQEQLSKTP